MVVPYCTRSPGAGAVHILCDVCVTQELQQQQQQQLQHISIMCPAARTQRPIGVPLPRNKG